MSGKYPNTFYRVAVKALIQNKKGEVLLVKENSDKWDLPGGGLDHGETAHDGMRREVLEELGVEDAVVGAPLLVQTFWLPEKDGWLMWIVYRVTLPHDDFRFGQGVAAIAYLDPARLADSADERERFIFTLTQRS